MALADTLVVEEARSATSAARLDTLLVTVPRGHMEEGTVVARAATAVAMEVAPVKDRLATHVEVSVTCLATAHKAKNATTVGVHNPASSSKC